MLFRFCLSVLAVVGCQGQLKEFEQFAQLKHPDQRNPDPQQYKPIFQQPAYPVPVFQIPYPQRWQLTNKATEPVTKLQRAPDLTKGETLAEGDFRIISKDHQIYFNYSSIKSGGKAVEDLRKIIELLESVLNGQVRPDALKPQNMEYFHPPAALQTPPKIFSFGVAQPQHYEDQQPQQIPNANLTQPIGLDQF